MERYNPQYGMDMLNGFVLPFATFLVIVIIVKNCLNCLSRKEFGNLVANVILGSMLIILFANPQMFSQIGNESIGIFGEMITGFFNIKEIT